MREKNTVELDAVIDRPSQKNLNYLRFFIPFLAPYKRKIVFSFFALFLASFMVLFFGWVLRDLIDQGFSLEDYDHLNQALMGMLVAILGISLASFFRSYYVSWVGERVVTDVRQKIYKHLLGLDLLFFETMRVGEIIARLTTDTNLVQILIGTSLAVAIRNLLMLVGGAIMMFYTSPRLSFYTVLIVPAVLIPIILFGKQVRILSKKSQSCLSDTAGLLEESLAAIKTSQSFQHELLDQKRFEVSSENTFQVSMKRVLARSFMSCLVMILVFSGVAFVLWSGGAEVIAGTLTPGVLSAFIFYAVVVAGSLGSFSEIYADLQRAAGAAERLEEMLTIQSALVEPRNPRLLPQPPRGVVALHNVTFSYPSQHDRPVLNNITLSVAPGEKLALVGTSGAGKSTILSLLMRFYSPQSGAIYIDGVDVREASIADVRSRIALVPQEPVIFSGTLYENILYGRPDATETEVWQAAEAAHLLGVIQSLPKGIHTPLGIKGIQLSGGQKQRVSIARAILKNPTILLLDEATNALDAESEKLVQDSLKPLIATRTTIIVAHRLATVLKADRIVVLDRGQIQSVGTHAELISEDGLYRRLATLQFTDSLELGRRSSRDTKVLWG